MTPSIRCVEMLISEQIRSYNEKMEEIEQLEFAEALAVNQLKVKRQNTVRKETLKDFTPTLTIHSHLHTLEYRNYMTCFSKVSIYLV